MSRTEAALEEWGSLRTLFAHTVVGFSGRNSKGMLIGSKHELPDSPWVSAGWLLLNDPASLPSWPRGDNTPTELPVFQSRISFNGIRKDLI